ncbi:hypothetical protein ACA910_004110 [Epithemia clementina (nom. ined.)]
MALLLASIATLFVGAGAYNDDILGNQAGNRSGTVPEDIGLCLGVTDDETEGVVGHSCRDFDRDRQTCDTEMEGCFWIPLPRCGEGPCLDLYTSDEDTTKLFVGTVFTACLLCLCCLTGWITVACCTCACARRRKRIYNQEQERRQVEEEIDARNAQVVSVDEDVRNDESNVTSIRFDERLLLEKDPETGRGRTSTGESSEDAMTAESSLSEGTSEAANGVASNSSLAWMLNTKRPITTVQIF